MLRAALVLLLILAGPVGAVERRLAEGGDLELAIAGATPGDVLRLGPGIHAGPVVIDKPLTLRGEAGAIIDGGGRGSVITVTGTDVTIRGLEIRGSGSDHGKIDAGIELTRKAARVTVEENRLTGNLYGIDVHGATDTILRGNVIEGRRDRRMNERGNGIYVWNAPGLLVEGNQVRWGRDGIFSNTSRDAVFRDNLFRDLRFAVHYMYTNNAEISGNVSIGNHLGYAIMFSNKVRLLGNLSLNDRQHGVMLNYANQSDVVGNLVRGGTEKCLFIYNAHRNLIANNRFEGCQTGIHFTAGSERNGLTGNAFIGNREQVKYVGSRDVEWSVEGRGNYWSDHPAYDLDTDGFADARYRPNDLMDHVLWSQPAAALLTGSPAVQLMRWAQASFPAMLPGGVVDSHPLTAPVSIPVPADIARIEAETIPDWKSDDVEDIDPLADH
ncbi:MAG: nitrous oxide reductase family maturation protein NosD [Paracoccus sp. (in: a-proteobacteria)]